MCARRKAIDLATSKIRRRTTAATHPELATGGWQNLSLLEQLANVGSEVERAIRAHEAGRQQRWEAALDRALELFDLTAADERWRGPRRRETMHDRPRFPDCANIFGTLRLRRAAARHFTRNSIHFNEGVLKIW